MKSRRLPSALGRRPLVVASIGDAAHLAVDARRAAKDGADVIEIRADLFPKSVLKPEPLRRLIKSVREAAHRPLLLTLRIGEEGGGLSPHFREQDRLALFRAALSDVQGVDIELSANEINRHVEFEAHKRGRFVVVSAHDFGKTPSNAVLSGLARKAKRLGADVLKVAARPRRRIDVERLMDFCAKSGFRRRVFIAMGPLGEATRRDGFRWGSCLTYGFVRRRLAPGQLPVKALAEASRALLRKAAPSRPE
ncbi:MAG TPA: type I 3-dehydroquinate dehydratase [Elusimicrobiota bacterium]|nr:type I 3-dehydroquinate dehydratase [Elusimicrobiota bacterium]